jgi:hypothetical protein
VDPIQAYDKATATITRQCFPTATELRNTAHKEQSSDRVKKKLTLRDHFGLAKELTRARREQKSIASEVARQLNIGGVGSVPTVKDDNTGRFLFENFNSLSPWNSFDKIYRLNSIYCRYNTDCGLGVETQIQFDMVRESMKDFRLDRLLLPGQDKRVITSHNKHERFHRAQYGGTCIATFNRLSQFVQDSGVDPHGLGRYSWFQVGSGDVSTIVVVLYIPCSIKVSESNPDQHRMTVYNQQRRYFRSIGDNRCPRAILVDHIGTQCGLWKAAGKQILLFTDANSDVYGGILAQRLNQDDVRMTEKCKEVLGHESPNSHSTGSLPISGVFATSEIIVRHVFQSAHGGGIGDHRLFVVDVDLSSMIGEDFPQLVRMPGRKLQTKRKSSRKTYNRILPSQTNREVPQPTAFPHHSLREQEATVN